MDLGPLDWADIDSTTADGTAVHGSASSTLGVAVAETGAQAPRSPQVGVFTDPSKRRRPRGPSRKGSMVDGLPAHVVAAAKAADVGDAGAVSGSAALEQLEEEDGGGDMDMSS